MKPMRRTLPGDQLLWKVSVAALLRSDTNAFVHRRTSLLAILFCDVCKLGGFQIDVVDSGIIPLLKKLHNSDFYRSCYLSRSVYLAY